MSLWLAAAVLACEIEASDYVKLRGPIAGDELALAVERARLELERDESCGPANLLLAEALLALGKPDEALASLTYWANRDVSDPMRVETLIDFHRRVGDGAATGDLIARIDALPASARPAVLRTLLDELYDAGQLADAASVLERLLPEANEDELGSLRRMLEGVSNGDLGAMWDSLSGLPSADHPARRTQALILVARRVASSCLSKPCGGSSPELKHEPSTSPRLSTKVEPSYPDRMRRERVEGTIVFAVAVLPSGEPILLGGQSTSDRFLRRAAAEAVAQWRYEPGRDGGEPVATLHAIRVDFLLR